MGKIVKKLATVYGVVAILVGVIGIVCSIDGLQDLDCIQYASIFGGSLYYPGLEKYGNNALTSILTIIPSVVLLIAGVIMYIMLSAFGELVENTDENKQQIEELKENQAKTMGVMLEMSNTLRLIEQNTKKEIEQEEE